MYNLQKRIKEQTNKKTSSEPTCENSTGRVSVRDRLLIQGAILDIKHTFYNKYLELAS